MKISPQNYSRVAAGFAAAFCLATAWASVSAADGDGVLLRYKLKVGETIPYEVTHVAKTKTSVRGDEETTNVRSVSQRHWEIVEVTDEGNMVFDHVIDSVSMTQQTDDDEIRWDSESGEEPPATFRAVADRIGRNLARITVDARGIEVSRENHGGTKAQLGMGSLTLNLPEQPLKIGESWSMPREVKARNDDGTVKVIKIREVYTLKSIKTGVATLSIRSEPLTPLNEESVRAQVVQQLSNGSLRFDVDNGRMLEKQLDWDENVVGFQGPTSAMEYRARMTETFVDEPVRTAAKPDSDKK